MKGTTPPWEMTTSPSSLFNLQLRRQNQANLNIMMFYALLIVPDSELKVTGDNTLLLVITRRVTRKLENLSCKVLEDGSEVDCATH